MDDITVKAELAALYGPKVEADTGASVGETPHDDPATTPNNGIMISNVVSMAASTKSEVVLPDVVGSAVHAVIELEPDELPAPATISGGISMFPTREPLDFSVGPRHPMAASPDPVSVSEHESVVTGGGNVEVASHQVIPNGDPKSVKPEREPSPEVVDLTEDAPSSPSPFLSDELCEVDEKPVELGEVLATAQESSPETDAYVNTVNAKNNPVSPGSPVPAKTSESAVDEENFRGFHEPDIAKAKKRSARFADFLHKYDCGGGGKERRNSKSSSNSNPKRRWFDGCQYRCGFCGLTFSQTSIPSSFYPTPNSP